MKLLKHTCGFTLVEALVVSVIVAIVGIAAVVTYSGYIKESRRQAVEGIADAAAVAANAYHRKVADILTAGDVNKLNLFYDPARLSIVIVPGTGIHGKIIVTDIAHSISDTAAY